MCLATGELTRDCALEHERAEGMGPSLSVEGATTSAVFEAYVEQVPWAHALRKGQVVVMDNLLKPTRAKGYAS